MREVQYNCDCDFNHVGSYLSKAADDHVNVNARGNASITAHHSLCACVPTKVDHCVFL